MQLKIKLLQKISIFILLSLLSCKTSSKAQILPNGQVYDLAVDIDYHARDGRYYKDINGNLDPFIGTWKNTTGNKTFSITIWKEEFRPSNGIYIDKIVGDYKMIENEGQTNENIIFTSRIMVGSTAPWSPAIYLEGNYPALSGFAIDNTYFTLSFKYVKPIWLEFTVNQGNATAHWKAKERKDMPIEGYNGTPLPLDIVMTKQ